VDEATFSSLIKLSEGHWKCWMTGGGRTSG